VKFGHFKYTNKAVIYRLLFEVAAETLRTIAADPKHLGARIGATLVLHTWGSALTHPPHVHGIAPGGGWSSDGSKTPNVNLNPCANTINHPQPIELML